MEFIAFLTYICSHWPALNKGRVALVQSYSSVTFMSLDRQGFWIYDELGESNTRLVDLLSAPDNELLQCEIRQALANDLPAYEAVSCLGHT